MDRNDPARPRDRARPHRRGTDSEKSAAVAHDRVDGRAAAVEERRDRHIGDDRRGSVLPRLVAETRRPDRIDGSLRPRPLRPRPAAAADRRGDHLARHRIHVLSNEESDPRRHRPRRVRRRTVVRDHSDRLQSDRDRRVKDRHCVLLLALIITGLFADVLFFGNNFYVRDLFTYHYPMKHIVREIIARGEFPWWNPYFASGQPMAANPAYEIFYPPQWLIFIGSFRFGFAIHILFHIYLAAFGAFFFFRAIPLRREAALFGALSFALSAFLPGTATNLPIFFVWSWAGVIGWAL